MSVLEIDLDRDIDDSDYKEKLDKIKKSNYFKRNIWTTKTRTYILSNDNDYPRFLLKSKNVIEESTVYNEETGKTINSTIYTDENEKFLYSTVMHFSDNVDANDYMGQVYSSLYMFISAQEYSSTGKGNRIVTSLPCVQLSRYDPIAKFLHVNDFDGIDESILEVYVKYYKQKADVPHFHFAINSNAKRSGDPLSLAMNLDNLIKYVRDLREANDNSPLLSDNLGLPYLYIKNNPGIYTTNITPKMMMKICNGEMNMSNFAKLKINMEDLYNTNNRKRKNAMSGIDAVLCDLLLLKYFHGTGGLQYELELATKLMSAGTMLSTNTDGRGEIKNDSNIIRK